MAHIARLIQAGLALHAIVEVENVPGRLTVRSNPRPPMLSVFETDPARPAIPIIFATRTTCEAICAQLAAPGRQFARASKFTAKPGAVLALPDANGEIAQVL